ncbi:HNH endonuclease [Streptomyces sp. QTS52]
MRHIDMSGLSAPQEWTDKTAATLSAIRAAMSRDEEHEFTPHWTDDAVREPLLGLVGRKCWYCESPILRADVHVDHFRPKSEVSGEAHPGYWWLAYDLSNYRIACKYCNSGGARFNGMPEGRAKSSRFPLLAGTRARRPQDDLGLEHPVLLDPATPGDCDLIGFDIQGFARRSSAAYSDAEELSELCRAEETIRILALNSSELIEQRQEVMRGVRTLADIAGLPAIEMLIAKSVGPKSRWSTAASTALALQRACAPSAADASRPSAAPSVQPVTAPARSKVDLLDLLKYLDPDELAAGIPLTGRHKNKVRRGLLKREGQIEVWGRAWSTPTSAARKATGSDDVNGWDFWRLTTGGVEQSLAEFRAAHTR